MLSDSELKVMAVVWRENGASARRISEVLADELDYSASATYTLIGRCIKKGALRRCDPGYWCQALISEEDVQNRETDALVDRLFGGSADKLFSALVSRKKVSQDEIDRLRTIVNSME